LREQAETVVEISRTRWKPEQRQEIIDSVEVELVPANAILRKYFDGAPHFLSIDTEGPNFDILQSIDFSQHRPIVVCVEGGRPLNDYDTLLGPHGYRRVCQTPDNLLFAR
jgi:hypothetical protein